MYPVTIITTRYQGTYEGGEWAAFPCYSESVPLEATGDDITCMSWWADNGDICGTGRTTDEAVKSLQQNLVQLVEHHKIDGALVILGRVFGRFQTISERSLQMLLDRTNDAFMGNDK